MRLSLSCLIVLCIIALSPLESRAGVGKIRKQLSREHRGQDLRLRLDVGRRLGVDRRSVTVLAKDGVSVLPVPATLGMPSLAWVGVDSFERKGRDIVVTLREPGYDPHRSQAGQMDTTIHPPNKWSEGETSGNLARPFEHQSGRLAGWRAHEARLELQRKMQRVLLRGESLDDFRAGLEHLFYLGGTQPSPAELAECRKRRKDLPEGVIVPTCDDRPALVQGPSAVSLRRE